MYYKQTTFNLGEVNSVFTLNTIKYNFITLVSR